MNEPEILWALANGAASPEIDTEIRALLLWPVGDPTRGPDAFRVIHLGWEIQSIVRVDDSPRRWKVVLTRDWPPAAEGQWVRRLVAEEEPIPGGRLIEFSAPGDQPWPAVTGAALFSQGWKL
jgi:hypothetical protein